MTNNAKTAITALRDNDHPLGRPLALCLMFETEKDQWLAASVFDLAMALDAALHIPSESLLAAIRVQWWADALAAETHHIAPLVSQLQDLFEINEGLRQQIITLIAHWQSACHDEARDSTEGWAATWALIATRLGHEKEAATAADIGHYLHHVVRGQLAHGGHNLDQPQIIALRRDDAGRKRSWLYLAGCFLRYMARPAADVSHPALGWHMLIWHIFRPPK